MKFVLVGLLLFCGSVWADDASDDDQLGRKNCRGWNQLTSSQALFYLVGLRDGILTTAVLVSGAEQTVAFYFPDGSTFGEAQKGINQICAQPENSNISVIFAQKAFTLKAHGSKPQEVEEYLRFMRIVNPK